ncbi:tetratricopeptide repeat-containing sulfotransferase family protein [Kordiimonas lacus]|uniref:Tetratricopeptide repeat-containing protein n=1 Tax=Kordiimonas lacus TaxID=637679 RepID=A0A1G6VUB3_9PROT|nr:sulfotransferase [Kordiimonas lacus]SDD57169.1 Tetratricopeptide repeat-containing protein [Kordiimonas lacus]
MASNTGTIGMKPTGAAPREMGQADVAKFLRRGYQALMRRDFTEAGNCCSLVLKYHPKLVEAHFLVGLVGIESGDWTTARRAFKNVVSLDDKHAAGWAQFARCCAKMGQFTMAEKAVINAEENDPTDPLVLDVIGNVHSLLGDQKTALVWFDKAKAAGKSAFFDLSRAKALTFLGRLDEAGAALKAVLAEKPDDGMAHWMLSRLGKAEDENHIAEMQKIADRMPSGHPSHAFLNYAIGKEYEDLEAWDDAYTAYEAGARARRAAVPHDEQAEAELFEALEQSFDKAWLDGIGEGASSDAPIFIVGQPRTGTTLVERIITAHSDVESAGELQQFTMAIKRQLEMSSPKPMTADIIKEAPKLDVKALGELYLETTKSVQPDAKHFIDKMPVNYMYLPLIASALPNAKIIHIVRDPMDSCFASYKQLFAEAYYHSYDQQEMALHHVRYRSLMGRWRALLGDRILDVAYEDVVQDLEPNARRIIDFLGLDWQDACVEFHKQDAAVTTASAAQVREKAHTRSVGRWKKFEKNLSPMMQVLKDAGLEVEP